MTVSIILLTLACLTALLHIQRLRHKIEDLELAYDNQDYLLSRKDKNIRLLQESLTEVKSSLVSTNQRLTFAQMQRDTFKDILNSTLDAVYLDTRSNSLFNINDKEIVKIGEL